MKNTILFWLAVIAIVYITNSCGARKSESEKTEISEKQDFSGFFRNSGNSEEFLKSINYTTAFSVAKVDDQNLKTTTKKTFTPQNPKVTASYIDPDGKKYELNNTAVTEETIIEKNNKKSEKSEKSEVVRKTDQEKRTQQKAEMQARLKAAAEIAAAKKNTNRQESSLWKWLWLLVPVGLFAGWKIYKRVNPVV
jgi:hypothetical protein